MDVQQGLAGLRRRQFLASASLAAAGTSFCSPIGAEENTARASLAGHRLTSMQTRRVPLLWPRVVGRNAKLDVHGRGPTATVVLLRSDRGAEGWGEILPGPPKLDALREECIGKSLGELIDPTQGILSPRLQPLDVALHDLAGVILNQPVWKMLGGENPKVFPVYSGMIYFDDLTPVDRPPGVDQVLRNCEEDRKLGYRQLKVKIGRGGKWMRREEGLRRDVEVVRAIASAFPDCQLLVDGNDGYDVEGLIRFLRGIDGVPLLWIEEPFVENEMAWRQVFDWTRRNGYSRTLLADGEQHNAYPVLEKLEADGILQVRLSDILDYGFTRWRRLMPQLQKTRTLASPHCWGSGLKTVYTAHLLAALGNAPTIEGVSCSHEHVDFGENVLRDGKQQVSSRPGFGLKLRS